MTSVKEKEARGVCTTDDPPAWGLVALRYASDVWRCGEEFQGLKAGHANVAAEMTDLISREHIADFEYLRKQSPVFPTQQVESAAVFVSHMPGTPALRVEIFG